MISSVNSMGIRIKLCTLCVAAMLWAGQAESAFFQGLGDLPGGSFLSYAQGVSADGWTLYNAVCISPDGKTIAGNGKNPEGETESWIANINSDTEEEFPWTLFYPAFTHK